MMPIIATTVNIYAFYHNQHQENRQRSSNMTKSDLKEILVICFCPPPTNMA